MYTIAAAKTLHEILNEEISPQRVEKVVMELQLISLAFERACAYACA